MAMIATTTISTLNSSAIAAANRMSILSVLPRNRSDSGPRAWRDGVRAVELVDRRVDPPRRPFRFAGRGLRHLTRGYIAPAATYSRASQRVRQVNRVVPPIPFALDRGVDLGNHNQQALGKLGHCALLAEWLLGHHDPPTMAPRGLGHPTSTPTVARRRGCGPMVKRDWSILPPVRAGTARASSSRLGQRSDRLEHAESRVRIVPGQQNHLDWPLTFFCTVQPRESCDGRECSPGAGATFSFFSLVAAVHQLLAPDTHDLIRTDRREHGTRASHAAETVSWVKSG